MSPTLYIIIVSRVNFNKLSRNFVGALRTTTNCRVSFIDFYLVFSRNFRIAFLPRTNIVILLEPYCGTITEPGLPVVGLSRLCSERQNLPKVAEHNRESPTTGNPGSVIVPEYGSSKITMFVWGKNAIPKFLENTK